MGDFYDVLPELSVEECNRIALDGGVISSHGYGYACPKGGVLNSEYRCLVVNKQGMGNHGSIVLRGRTPLAREYIREGKIRSLGAAGVHRRVAERCAAMHRGMEIEVALLAQDICSVLHFVPADACLLDVRSHRRFGEIFEDLIDIPGLSMPRKESALKIALSVQSPDRGPGPVPRQSQEEKRLTATIAEMTE